MAITVVQSGAIVTGTTPVTCSFTDTPTNGNLLICYATGTTVIGNTSMANGWVLAVSALRSTTGTLGLWYKIAGAGESKDATITWTSSTDTRVKIWEYSGFVVPTLDKTAKTNNTGTGTSRSSGTTATISTAVELCFAAVNVGNTISGETWSNSFTTLWRTSPTPTDIVGTLVTAATAAYETTLSWTTSRVAGGVIATFMSAPVSGWIPMVIMVL